MKKKIRNSNLKRMRQHGFRSKPASHRTKKGPKKKDRRKYLRKRRKLRKKLER